MLSALQPGPSSRRRRNAVGSDAPDGLVRLAELFFLLGGANRLIMLARCLESPVRVTDLTECTGLSQSLVSHHLRQLREGELLRAERRGNEVYYSATSHFIFDVLRAAVRAGEPLKSPTGTAAHLPDTAAG